MCVLITYMNVMCLYCAYVMYMYEYVVRVESNYTFFF